jgi:penicillin-binding protein 2
MTRSLSFPRVFTCLLALLFSLDVASGATRKRPSKPAAKRPVATKTSTAAAKKTARKTVARASGKASTRKVATTSKSRSRVSPKLRKARYTPKSRKSRVPGHLRYVAGGPWLAPTYADSTEGDVIDGEDLTVRRAAVEALGPYNGTVVVTDPQTGRILTIVNQKTAFGEGFQPCSTVKIYAALAGLNEGVIDRNSGMRLYGRTYMNLTDALARSNNPYFANIGVKLGYEKIAYYARLYGLGEKAVLNVPEEQVGTIPPGPPANGGMGMMTSFGEGIRLTPLQLSAALGAIANGGTLYHLQYPRNQQEAANFVPQVKRHIPMQQLIPEVLPGMLAATEYGTARRAHYASNEPIFGKTGTCTDRATPTHLGWFGSFNEVDGRKLVVVVLLTGGRPVNGPVASGIAGQIYRNLSQQKYFARGRQSFSPVALISGASW